MQVILAWKNEYFLTLKDVFKTYSFYRINHSTFQLRFTMVNKLKYSYWQFLRIKDLPNSFKIHATLKNGKDTLLFIEGHNVK